MLFPRNLQEEEHRVEELEKKEQDPERMEFQDEDDKELLDEMECQEVMESQKKQPTLNLYRLIIDESS